MKPKYAFILLPLFLTGCIHLNYLNAAAELSDTQAEIFYKGPCAIGLGAWVRLSKAKQRVVGDYAEEMCR